MQKDDKSLSFKTILLSTAYLAPVEYYKAIATAEKVLLEQKEFYIKQSYRNRCKIATANGVMDLSIPVEGNGKKYIRDIRISSHHHWQAHHWKSIESAYKSSPFFEYYTDDLKPFYERKWVYLWDFNFEIQQKVAELLDVELELDFTEKYDENVDENVLDLRNMIHPKRLPVLTVDPYYQVFQQKYNFTHNLSIIDLLFNMGNESLLYLIDK